MDKAEYVFYKLAQTIKPVRSAPPWNPSWKPKTDWQMPADKTTKSNMINSQGIAMGARRNLQAEWYKTPVSSQTKMKLDSLINSASNKLGK